MVTDLINGKSMAIDLKDPLGPARESEFGPNGMT